MVLNLIKEAIVNLENSNEKIKQIKVEEGDLFADLHIHSKYSRATSKNLDIDSLVKWARVKGIGLLGTGDISHEKWLKEIKEKLSEENGILWYRDDKGDFPFILSGEISLVFTAGGKGRRVHLVYLSPSLEVNEKINKYLDTKGRRDYDGRPIFNISCEEFIKQMMEIDKNIEVIFAHCMTPWFGVFGSESGFNSLKEALGEQYENVHAVESGMSADPEMLWKLRFLEDKAIVSFSDSHSFWPWRIGREATIFKMNKEDRLSYELIINQIRNKTFKATLETEPAYGKYHWDGHRACNFSCSPEKSREINAICPVCNKKLVIGVENRVEELSENNKKRIPSNAKPFYKILPLHELICFYLKSGINSKKTWKIYNQLIEKFGNELNVLLRADKGELAEELKENVGLIEVIIDNRIANIKVKPGYDGTYGEIMLKEKQARLF